MLFRSAEPIAEKALRGVFKVTSGLGALPQVLLPLVTAGQRAIPAMPGINQGIKESIKAKFCTHAWKQSQFQMLTDDATTSYICTKCGKHSQF